ncbi:hypothetical protein J3R74_001544 [Puniceicoccus vermicola]
MERNGESRFYGPSAKSNLLGHLFEIALALPLRNVGNAISPQGEERREPFLRAPPMNPIFSGIYSKSLSRFRSGIPEMRSLLMERNGESRFYGPLR